MFLFQYLFICLVSCFAEYAISVLDAWTINTGSNSITTSAYDEIEDSTTVRCLHFMASNQTTSHIVIAIGGSGAEVDKWVLPPKGGFAFLPVRLSSGLRISLKAVDATASSGFVVIQCYY